MAHSSSWRPGVTPGPALPAARDPEQLLNTVHSSLLNELSPCAGSVLASGTYNRPQGPARASQAHNRPAATAIGSTAPPLLLSLGWVGGWGGRQHLALSIKQAVGLI
jgi:hypothetical protein